MPPNMGSSERLMSQIRRLDIDLLVGNLGGAMYADLFKRGRTSLVENESGMKLGPVEAGSAL
jgi:hypothetical protein